MCKFMHVPSFSVSILVRAFQNCIARLQRQITYIYNFKHAAGNCHAFSILLFTALEPNEFTSELSNNYQMIILQLCS